jgi:hypothetical protein
MAVSGGQNLHGNPMGNKIFIFFLRTAEQNLTKFGIDVSCEVEDQDKTIDYIVT